MFQQISDDQRTAGVLVWVIVGNFRHVFEVLDPSGQRAARVNAVVDTGSAYTWVPRQVLEQLGWKPILRRRFKLAGGRTAEYDVTEALVRLADQTLHTLCVFADPPAEPLLGAITLEAFGLGVDPVQQDLVPVVLLAVGNLSPFDQACSMLSLSA